MKAKMRALQKLFVRDETGQRTTTTKNNKKMRDKPSAATAAARSVIHRKTQGKLLAEASLPLTGTPRASSAIQLSGRKKRQQKRILELAAWPIIIFNASPTEAS